MSVTFVDESGRFLYRTENRGFTFLVLFFMKTCGQTPHIANDDKVESRRKSSARLRGVSEVAGISFQHRGSAEPRGCGVAYGEVAELGRGTFLWQMPGSKPQNVRSDDVRLWGQPRLWVPSHAEDSARRESAGKRVTPRDIDDFLRQKSAMAEIGSSMRCRPRRATSSESRS